MALHFILVLEFPVNIGLIRVAWLRQGSTRLVEVHISSIESASEYDKVEFSYSYNCPN